MWNIIIGIVFIIGGMSGTLVLRFTNSSEALIAVGGGLVIWGIIQVLNVKPRKKLNKELSETPEVTAFVEYTLETWKSGILNNLSPTYQKDAKQTSRAGFILTYGPFEGSVLEYFFSNYTPSPNEFLIGFGGDDLDENGWFILTNQSLIIKDGTSKEFQLINPDDIESFKMSDNTSVPCVFKLKNGNAIEINKVKKHPPEKMLQYAMDLNAGAIPVIPNIANPVEENKIEENKAEETIKVIFDRCPACDAKILESDRTCPDCGIALK